MGITWINISTKWSLTGVQASVNVIISVLGTIGIWAFSRYWWQRGGRKVLKGKSDVPLSALLTLAGPGEGWDAARILRKKFFARENWRLLFQLIVVIVVTTACMFAGPIAKASLRSARTVQLSELQVLQASRGDTFLGNRISADVQWNDTMQSLDEAGFPYDQLLDYIPPLSAPWMYAPREWSPTWSASCKQYEETTLHGVTATGNATWAHPLDAFPAYRATYDPLWLDASKFRMQADFSEEWVFIDEHQILIKDAIFFILIQSDPDVDDRMYTNNETLQISISALHARNFLCKTYDDATQAGLDMWQPIGVVQNASFSRVECNITRKATVANEDAIPWPWTNDTHSIANAYKTYWITDVGEKSSKNQTVTTPSPQKLFRFYQAYMISVNTWLSRPSLRKVSVWKDTVQLSCALLVVILLMTLLELWLAIRYFWFLWRHRLGLEKLCIPDGKFEWMVRAAKLASHDVDEEEEDEEKPDEDVEAQRRKPPKDRDYLRKASFGNVVTDPGKRPMELARVHLSRQDTMNRVRRTYTGRTLCEDGPQDEAAAQCPKIVFHTDFGSEKDPEKEDLELRRVNSPVGSCSGTTTVSVEREGYRSNRLSPTISRDSSTGRGRSSLNSDSSSSSSSSSSKSRKQSTSPATEPTIDADRAASAASVKTECPKLEK